MQSDTYCPSEISKYMGIGSVLILSLTMIDWKESIVCVALTMIVDVYFMNVKYGFSIPYEYYTSNLARLLTISIFLYAMDRD